jgi:uncharacterized RDD family membrane protein YckC
MARSQSHSSLKSIPTVWLVLLLAALCLVLVAALLPADVAWATPPQQGTVPPERPPNPPGIPEPATITLVGLGVGALAGYAWRRRKTTDEKSPEE